MIVSAHVLPIGRNHVVIMSRPAFLEDALDALPQGVALFSSDQRFLLCNDAFRGAVGEDVDVSSFAGEPAAALVDRFFSWSEPSAFNEGLSAGQGRFTLQRKDGTSFDAEIRPTSSGNRLLMLSETSEEQAEASEADLLLNTIVDACPANFMVSRIEDGKVIYYSAASRNRFGKIESTLSFFLKPEDRQAYLDALLPSGVLNEYRVRFRRNDGSIMDGMTSARVTEFKGENVIVSSTRDISEQLAMQAELERQREIAHQSEKLSALGELLAGVAHELNNPLSVILGYAQMLDGTFSDPVQAKRMERIAQAAERSSRIVKTFLAMARQGPARRELLAVDECLSIALDVREYGLDANGTRVTMDVAADLPSVMGDRDQLVQVFTNLIANAEHAVAPLGPEGHLTLRVQRDVQTDQVCVEISDNGPGIPTDIRARIFEPFFTTKEMGEGTGFGLSFCHRIAEAHGGAMEVVSEPGGETSFFVRLPVAAIEDLKTGSEATARTVLPSAHVLVVDDDEAVLELTRDLLDDLGMKTETCCGGREALDRLQSERFDAVICDFKMPEMDGAAFYEALGSERPDHADRVGFITGDTMGAAVSSFFELNDVPFIEKPLSRAGLEALLSQLLRDGERR